MFEHRLQSIHCPSIASLLIGYGCPAASCGTPRSAAALEALFQDKDKMPFDQNMYQL